MQNPQRFWIGFNHIKGIGPVQLRRLRAHFGDLGEAWHAAPEALAEAGLGPKLREKLVIARAGLDLERMLEGYNQRGIRVLTWDDPDYPNPLKEIDGSPPVLYLRGDLQPGDHWAVGVVGTRRMSAYGRQVTQDLVSNLARVGLTVVSGLARGVDSIAHREALRMGGRTIAVLGSGVDLVYPPENRELASQIQNHGAVISDYPPSAAPEALHFPARNRIIAGLSRIVVVVEAGECSGALITASFAADQGKDVFAVPGGIYSRQSQGTNRLIQLGARPLLQPLDVLDMLDLAKIAEQKAARRVIPENEIEAVLLAVLDLEPRHIDELCARSGRNVQDVSPTLTLLELKGVVRNVGNMRYVLVR